jgi:hypothetical protein
MTDAPRKCWQRWNDLKRFRFSDALKKADTTNKKAVSAALKIAVAHGLLTKQGDTYIRT